MEGSYFMQGYQKRPLREMVFEQRHEGVSDVTNW